MFENIQEMEFLFSSPKSALIDKQLQSYSQNNVYFS